LRNLKTKVDAGADFITTQLFFDNAVFLNFAERCRAAGITVPIIPGILPALSHAQVQRFTGFCGAAYPAGLAARLQPLEGREAEAEAAGVAWADEQIRGLVEAKAPGLHLYIMNRASSALALFARLKEEGVLN
jgi:methylenetetrahydrofolate reductase (NADPH)